MMKRILVVLAFCLLPAGLYADIAERDVLLAPDGTLYAVDSEMVTETSGVETSSQSILRLTVQRGDDIQTSIVPGSLTGGTHYSPSLAYDPTDHRLFLFWQKMPNMMSSELLFSSFKDGAWSDTTSIDNAPYHFRFSLRIATTRTLENVQGDGTTSPLPMLVVHAVWWDQTGYGESGRYAMLGIDGGTVTSLQVHELLSFAGDNPDPTPFELPPTFNRDFFRNPAIFEAPTHDSVDIVFANWDTNRIERVKVKPIAENGVLHLPIGAWGGELKPPVRANFQANSNSVYAMKAQGSDAIAYYYRGDKGIRYMLYRDGDWTDENTIATGAKISEETGVTALRRLVDAQ